MDIRDQLRRDHAKALAEVSAIGSESDGRRAQARLTRLRHAWRIHELAEAAVVYRALEGGVAQHADERFAEHEHVEGLFEQISQASVGTLEWQSRIDEVLGIVRRHIETEEGGLFLNLSERYSAPELVELGTKFILARDKLAMLEEAKRAA